MLNRFEAILVNDKKLEWADVDPGNTPRTLDGERIDNDEGYDVDDYRIVNIDLTQTKIKNKTFINLEFHCVKFNYTEISNTQFYNCKFYNCRFNNTTFKNVEMKNIVFDTNTFYNTIFDTCRLVSIQSDIDLTFADDKVQLKNTIVEDLKPEDSVKDKTQLENIFDSLVELLENGGGELEDVIISAPKKENNSVVEYNLNEFIFKKITFKDLIFKDVDFNNCQFCENTTFNNCQFYNCNFTDVFMNAVVFSNCSLKQCLLHTHLTYDVKVENTYIDTDWLYYNGKKTKKIKTNKTEVNNFIIK